MWKNQLKILFKKKLKDNIEMSGWAAKEVLRCFDGAIEEMGDCCPLCGDGCDCLEPSKEMEIE